MSTTSVIIVVHNNQESLPACLNSLAANNPHEIIIVENSRNPWAASISRKYNCRYYTVSNQGFAAAANFGAIKAQGVYLLFLNPDAVVPNNTLHHYENFFVTHPSAGIISGVLVNTNGSPEADSFGSDVTPWSLFCRQVLPSTIPQTPLTVGWVSGAALFIQRQQFLKIDGFDPTFFLYWEDVDLCRRFKVQFPHQTITLLPHIKIQHMRGASNLPAADKTRIYDASADRYFSKYYAKPICQLLRWFRVIYRWWQPQAR